MKTKRRWAVVAMVFLGWFTSFGQVSEPEVPGDHFSLEGALELFKKSASPQEFEKMLNSPDSKVNNLDLNGDGYIDYVRVLDRYEGNVHAFIIQAVISENESQDIAVIELEKLSNGKAVLQIVGDEDVYGVTTIIEPTREVRTYAGTRTSTTVVNVWGWPSVQYIYGPSYSVWISPWGWHHRPVWYHTWRPVSYVHYYSIWRPYHPYYVTCHTRRVVYAHEIYRPHRRTSVVVHKRYNDRIVRYRTEHRDEYRNGRTRDDNRRIVDNGWSSSGTIVDRRRVDADAGRRSVVRPEESSRSINRTRSSENTNVQRPAVRERSVPTNSERKVPADRQRSVPADRERSTPDIQRNQVELRRDAAGDRRSGTVHTSTEIRQQAARPSFERSRPEPHQTLQQQSAPRERSVSVADNNRSVREATSRPPTVSRSRPSERPAAVQQRTPSRSSGDTKSAGVRRGRQ